jgi:hypothetical protein
MNPPDAMTSVLTLLLVNAVLGAWDTLWYHEYRARLWARVSTTRTELRLHAGRDAVYALLYGFLAWWRPGGWAVALVIAALVTEIAITMTDFVVEDRDRPAIGGIAPGERVLHSTMAIVYGAMLITFAPELLDGVAEQTQRHAAPAWMSWSATAAAVGIALSGGRDAWISSGFTADALADHLAGEGDHELALLNQAFGPRRGGADVRPAHSRCRSALDVLAGRRLNR